MEERVREKGERETGREVDSFLDELDRMENCRSKALDRSIKDQIILIII